MKRLCLILIAIMIHAALACAQSSFSSPNTGTNTLGSYFATDIDSVSLTDGNLNLNIPLFSLPGREVPLSLGASYNSEFIEQRTGYDEYGDPYNYYEFYGWRKATSLGGALVANSTPQNPSCNTNQGCNSQTWNVMVQWVKNDGTKYPFTTTVQQTYGYYWGWSQDDCDYEWLGPAWQPAMTALYDNLGLDSVDSEFLHLNTGVYFDPNAPSGSAATIYSKDGTRSIFYTGSSPSWEVRSTNGNRLQASGQTTSDTTEDGSYLNDVVPLTDTVGRTISHSGGNSETITLTDANSDNKVYGINWEAISVNQIYGPCNCSIMSATYRVIQSIVLPNNKSYQFTYDGNGNLTKVVLPSGGYIRYVYYGVGSSFNPLPVYQRIVSSDGTSGSEKTWTYEYGYGTGYNSDGNPYWWLSNALILDPIGNTENHGFSAPSSCGDGQTCVGAEIDVQYFQSGTPLKEVQTTWSTGNNPAPVSVVTLALAPVAQTNYTYDAYDNVTEKDDYTCVEGSGCALLRTVKFTYEGTPYTSNYIENRLLNQKTYDPTNTLNAETDYGYDDYTDEPLVSRSGSIPGWISPGSNPRGNVTSIKQWLNTNNSWLTAWKQYDTLGNVVVSTDPAGYATTTSYTDNFVHAPSGAAPTFALPTQTTAPSGFSVTSTYDFNTGLTTQSEDSLSRITSNSYDQFNRVTQTNYPNGGYTEYTYDDTTPAVTKQVLVDSSGNVGTVKTTYDLLYREIHRQTWDPEGNIYVDTQYDAKGRKSQVSNPYRTGDTEVWTQFAYDGVDRTVTTTGPDGSTTQYGYLGNQTTITDQAGNARMYAYDGLGRMTMVQEPNPLLTSPVITTYTYNVLAKMIGSNQSGQTRSWAFDSLGRMTSQTLPESGTTSFTYNAEGLLTAQTDARSMTTTITYGTSGGSINKLVSRTYSDSTPSVSFTYNSRGLRTGMTDGLGSVSYTYDSNTDKLTQESRTLTGVSGTFSAGYSYNIKGDLTSMTYPSGRVVSFGYETGGGASNSRLSSVADATTDITLANMTSYSAAGGKLSETLNPGTNAVVNGFAYNNRNQLTQITAAVGTTTMMNLSYSYGTSSTNTGRVLARTDAIQQEHSVNYSYDPFYRLQQVVGQDSDWGIAWTFDVWGNRLSQTPQGLATLKVGTQTLAYTNNENTSLTYDSAGNETNDGSNTYGFNANSQVTAMDAGSAIYGYDGDGRRLMRMVGSASTYYFYSVLDNALLCEFTTSTTGTASASSSDHPFYRTSDNLGSAVLTITASGTVIENNRTLPYGEQWLLDTVSTNNEKFTTYERDSESALDYAMDRYMANGYGRFQSSDEGAIHLMVPSTLNRYVYAMNDPINHVDPMGMDGCAAPEFQTSQGMSGSSLQSRDVQCGDLSAYPPDDGNVGGGGGGIDDNDGCDLGDAGCATDGSNNTVGVGVGSPFSDNPVIGPQQYPIIAGPESCGAYPTGPILLPPIGLRRYFCLHAGDLFVMNVMRGCLLSVRKQDGNYPTFPLPGGVPDFPTIGIGVHGICGVYALQQGVVSILPNRTPNTNTPTTKPIPPVIIRRKE